MVSQVEWLRPQAASLISNGYSSVNEVDREIARTP
jgi:hypothetical protein